MLLKYKKQERQESNPWPLILEINAIPLSYFPFGIKCSICIKSNICTVYNIKPFLPSFS
jgi:hypothetical protein